MTIKLNEFDRKLLSSIKPSDTWQKLKNIYTINGEVKRLKIGNKKIGRKCAIHLKKLSNKSEVTLNEIKDGCKDLIPKKHKHGLVKDKTKRGKETEHTKLDVGQDKPEKSKVKKPAKPRQPSATQQLVNLLTQQQLIAKKQTIQTQIQEVDKILTDRNQNVELPKQPQISQLQLTRQSLGQQRQVGGLGIYAPLPRRPPRPSMPSITQNINGNVVGTTKTDEEILNQLRQNNQERLQQIESIQQQDKSGAFRSLTNKLTDKDKNNRQNQLLDALTRMGQNQRTERNQKIFEDLTKKVESKQIDQNLDFLNELKAEVSQQRFIADTQKRQEDSLNEAMNIMREKKAKQIEDTLGNLQSGVMPRVSGIGEQQNIFDRNTRLNLEKSESLGDMMTDREQELELGRTGSLTSRLPETSLEELQNIFKLAQKQRDIKLKKARELLELQQQEKQTSDLVDRLILDTEETNKDVDKFKKEMTMGEVEADKPSPPKQEVKNPTGPRKKKEKKILYEGYIPQTKEEEKSIKDLDRYGFFKKEKYLKEKEEENEGIIGNPISNIKYPNSIPAQKGDTTFYNTNYKKYLDLIDYSKKQPIYNNPSDFDGFNATKKQIKEIESSKEKYNTPYRKELRENLLDQLYTRQIEQHIDRYLLVDEPLLKKFHIYQAVGAQSVLEGDNDVFANEYKKNNKPTAKYLRKIEKEGEEEQIEEMIKMAEQFKKQEE